MRLSVGRYHPGMRCSCGELQEGLHRCNRGILVVQVLSTSAETPTGCPVSLIDETTRVYMQLGDGDVDHGKELEKHLKEKVKLSVSSFHHAAC